jgi:hypothetical protein
MSDEIRRASIGRDAKLRLRCFQETGRREWRRAARPPVIGLNKSAQT